MDNDPTIVESSEDTGLETPTSELAELVEDELLVEEISIDGMCGVY